MKPRRGRPVKLDALSPAERQKRYRESQRAKMAALQESHVTEKDRMWNSSHVTEIAGLVLLGLEHMRNRCLVEGSDYSIDQLIEGAIRGQLVKWGYSVLQEDLGELCFGGQVVKDRFMPAND